MLQLSSLVSLPMVIWQFWKSMFDTVPLVPTATTPSMITILSSGMVLLSDVLFEAAVLNAALNLRSALTYPDQDHGFQITPTSRALIQQRDDPRLEVSIGSFTHMTILIAQVCRVKVHFILSRLDSMGRVGYSSTCTAHLSPRNCSLSNYVSREERRTTWPPPRQPPRSRPPSPPPPSR